MVAKKKYATREERLAVKRGRQAAARKRNPEKCKAYHAEWYAKNREKKKARCLAYYYANRDRIAAQQRIYREANREVIRLAENMDISYEAARLILKKLDARRAVTTGGNDDRQAHHQPPRRGVRQGHAHHAEPGLPLDRRADPGAGHARTHGAPVR